MYKEYLRHSEFGSYEDFLRNFEIVAPENFNFAYDVVDRIAAETPDKRALVWVHPDGRRVDFTFADIKRESDRAANLFRALGIGRGDVVMLVLMRHYQFWFSIMALHKLGAIAAPATHLLTKKDIVYRANAASVKAVVCTSYGAFADHLDEALAECPTVAARLLVGGSRDGYVDFDAELPRQPERFERPRPANANGDIMMLYFTSGTSGMPKMVVHDFTYPLGHIQTAVYWQGCVDGGLHLTVSETGWAKSVWGKLYGQWLAGSAVLSYDYDKFDAKALLRVLADTGVTTFCAPPTIYRFFIQEDLSAYDLSRIVRCSIAGEPLNPEVYNKWLKLTGHSLKEIYGQTELCVTVGTFPWMKVCPGSMGKPSPMFDVDIVDDDGVSCPPGQVGEIVVRTRGGRPIGMFMGYYRERERTDSVWSGGMYHTLDLAWRDEWGYYWYVGRADDVIKSSGYRIGPFEVESALMEHPTVVETAITGVPDEVRGQLVKATVVLAKGIEPSDALKKELQEHVKRVTAPYKYPRIIEFVDALPKTISGKVRRVELRERDASK
ncbi:MAG: AMP-binding protein [Clostridiales bacterium]|nr:AMP-binding protein [Clostridiales bacterium]